MKQLTEYTRVSGYLVKIFNALNATFFESKLSTPVITIQNTPRAYGHVSIYEVWTSGEQNRRELNIGAGTINRPIENVVATLLHEMVHLYNMERGVQDCSRGGAYHNKHFKEAAEARALKIDHHPTYGWTITTPTDALVQWCLDHDLEEIKVYRNDGRGLGLTPPTGGTAPTGGAIPPVSGTPTPRQSTRKMICPLCGAIVRTTKDIKVICGECYLRIEIDPENIKTVPFMVRQG